MERGGFLESQLRFSLARSRKIGESAIIPRESRRGPKRREKTERGRVAHTSSSFSFPLLLVESGLVPHEHVAISPPVFAVVAHRTLGTRGRG